MALAQDYEVFLAEDRVSALVVIKREQPRVVTLDLGLPPCPGGVEEGFLALGEMFTQDGFLKIIIITGQGEKDHALKAIGQGAYDFFCKPIQIDDLKTILKRAFYVSQLEIEHRELKRRLGNASFEEMMEQAPGCRKFFPLSGKWPPLMCQFWLRGRAVQEKNLWPGPFIN